jgi:hypothetical protein
MRVRIKTIAPTVAIALAASTAEAQSNVTLVPSVTIGAVYDDNLFARADGSAGEMFQIRPSLEANYESPRLTFLTLYSWDMERSNHAALNTLDARRHGMLDARYRTTQETTFGLTTRYDRTETPGEINIESGVLSDRRQAQRWELTPSVAHRFGLLTTLTVGYDWTSENIVSSESAMLHSGRIALARELSSRTNISATYLGRYFIDPFDSHSSQALLAGWERELSSATRLTLQAGPRVTSYRGIEPEVVAAIARTTNRIVIAVDYWHGETIVLGIHGPVGVNSGTARVTWPFFKRTIEFGTHAGISDIATLDGREATIYRGTLVGSWTPRRSMFTVAASYGVDYQQGDIRRNLFAEREVLRHVFRVGMTIAPRLSRSILPPDEAARAKGVTR